jgi:DNA-binding NtrC family response regulator
MVSGQDGVRWTEKAAARTVVLASADADLRHRLAGLLTAMRWEVREAAGGAEATAQLETFQAEALFVDSWLPDLEVSEFAEQMRGRHPGMDLLRIDGGFEETGARSPRRNELLHALRHAQTEAAGGSTETAAWAAAPVAVPQVSVADRVAPRDQRAAATLEVADYLRTRKVVGPPREIGGPVPGEAQGEAPADAVAVGGRAGDVVRGAVSLNEVARRGTGAGPGVLPAPVLPEFGMPGYGLREIEAGVGRTVAATAAIVPAILSAAEQAARASAGMPLPDLIGTNAGMRELARMVRLVAPRSTTVLIEGATGTGKELVAKAVHRLSARASKPFVVLNCAAIPESLLEAELFGHTRGAFTGAVQSRTGRVEAANGGTLFLDEIGEMPLALQAKMLRFLESGEIQRVGGNETVRVDVRVVAATHQPLKVRTADRAFRLDLYHRLAVFPLAIPALRDRMDDLLPLAMFFLDRLGEEMPVKRLSAGALERLRGHDWPGNVRELEHVLERATILAEGRPEISAADIRP